MSKSPLPHLDKPDEETIDKMKSSDYSKNQKVQDEILKFLENDKQLIKAIRKEWFWTKGIVIFNTVLSVISVIIALISLIVSIYK
jgi:maltodextrin utilization protein YvdJ